MTTRNNHPHPYTDELLVFFIPALPEESMGLVAVQNRRDHLAQQLSAGSVYTLDEDLGLPALDCTCPLSMLVNYENQLKQHSLQFNARASLFMSKDEVIFGDILLLAQGMVQYADGRVDVDFVSLTPQFHDWSGPGHPVPTPNLPWSQ